ncbi:hypothetical protein O1611_g6273 [Lasiodiplodia mahajangana]|uniref:Uncharacterized protein n=1 Tax=Lasiodiplodia mahajangana TaxID=1108764 RepID=A0ACC2JJF8_9PEZI|nr:hypothetical protein O1611_g6273 [Lasiodiplodia mahajangana]
MAILDNQRSVGLHSFSRVLRSTMHHQQYSSADLQLYVGLGYNLTETPKPVYLLTLSSLWDDLLWQQLAYIKANYKNADVIFNNGNFGFMRALAVIRLFCYIVESSYLLAYCIKVTTTVYNFWATRRDAERIFTIVARVAPIILALITIGLLQTPAVQSSFTVYMIVANVQSILSCAVSIVLLFIIIRLYIQSKLAWRRVQGFEEPGFWSRLRNSSSSDSSSKGPSSITPVYSSQATIFDDNWVVIRLSIAVVLISAFIVANIVTHLPQRDDVARDAKAEYPDLSPERARSNIIGYIFGVTPGLAIWIVFGLTKDFRQIMYETFVPRSWRRWGPTPAEPLDTPWDSTYSRQPAELSGVAVETGIQLDNVRDGPKRRPMLDVTDAS